MEFGWKLKNVSIPEEGLEGSRLSESDDGWFSEADEWGCVCWRNNAEIELDDDLVQDEDSDWMILISTYECELHAQKMMLIFFLHGNFSESLFTRLINGKYG